MNKNIYAVYRGEQYLFDGTLTEICEKMNWKRSTARWYTYKAAKKRAERPRKNRYNSMIELVMI